MVQNKASYDGLFKQGNLMSRIAIVHEMDRAWDWDTWASESLREFAADEPEPTEWAMTE